MTDKAAGDAANVKPETVKSGDSSLKDKSDPKRKGAPSRYGQKVFKFDGFDTDLNGYVTFDMHGSRGRQIDEYNKSIDYLKIYSGREYGHYVALAIENLSDPTAAIPKPTRPSDPKDEIAMMEYRVEYTSYNSEVKKVQADLKKLYQTIWGQCSDRMQSRIMELKEYENFKSKSDTVGLIEGIRNIVFNYRTHQHPIVGLHLAKYEFYKSTQGNQNTQEYYDHFMSTVEVHKTIGSSLGIDPAVISFTYKENGIDESVATKDEERKVIAEAKERYLAIAMLMAANRSHYGGLVESLANDYLKGDDKYPKTLTECFTLLNHWSNDPRNVPGVVTPKYGGPVFAQTGDTDGKGCDRCGRSSHDTKDCYAKTHLNGTSLLMMGRTSGYMFSTSSEDNEIPKSWILLDNQSTIDVFSNSALLDDIHEVEAELFIRCNAGVARTNQRGTVPGYGEVWYHPDGIANIFSLSRMKDRFRVTYDSASTNAFTVHKDDGTTHVFREDPSGLYYMDAADTGMESPEVAFALVNTVASNKANFSDYDYSQAVLARSIQKRLGRPSTKDFIYYVNNHMIPNCPVTAKDIRAAELIFGPDVGSLKGKTVRDVPVPVRTQVANIPATIMSQYRNITLSVDIMKVNSIPFLMTISKHLKFGTSAKLDSMTDRLIFQELKGVNDIYRTRGFRVELALADNQFESIRGDLAGIGITLNVVSRDEHVPELERYIRTVKERTRAIYNVMPFRHFPPLLVIEMVYHSVFWLNMFPSKNGVSKTLSPAQIVTGRSLDFNSHCRVEFGQYVQTHEEHDNSMQSRTIGAIALRPCGNSQGGYFFLSLETGRRIIRNRWTPLPMPSDVIIQVHCMARQARAKRDLVFTDRNNNNTIFDIMDDDTDDDDDDYVPPATDDYADDDIVPSSDSPDDDSTHSDDPMARYDPGTTGVDDNVDNDDEEMEESTDQQEQESTGVENTGVDITGVDTTGVHSSNAETDDNLKDDDDEDDIEDEDNVEVTVDDLYPPTYEDQDDDDSQIKEDQKNTGVFGSLDGESKNEDERAKGDMKLRYRARLDYKKLHRTGKLENHITMNVLGHVDSKRGMTFVTEQMNWRKGLKVFKDKGEEAIEKELKQVDDMEGFEPKKWNELTDEQRKNALQYLMYLKEKRCGRIKARGCADGRKQRLYMSKEETSSPTVSLAALMMTSVVDAHEGRYIVVVDIPGAFLQTEMTDEDGEVIVLLEGRMAEILAKIDPTKYSKAMFVNKGQAGIYVKLKKALYGTLKAALLFWKNLSEYLVSIGFEINPYDSCVANKMVNGKQCTVVWHVDDLKISHAEQSVVDDIIAKLNQKYGKVAPLTVNRGPKFNYLGMDFDFSEPGKVKITMESYIDSVLAEVPTDMGGDAVTPAARHLFDVNKKNPERLGRAEAEEFHHIVAQLLFLCKRTRLDVQTTVAFLCTRVQNPDRDDYKKLARLIRYLRSTKHLPLTLEASDVGNMQWWVDGAFGVHPDMKSHTGMYMSMGKGGVIAGSSKQKLNTTSSTEAELVAVSDAMPQVLWCRYFMEKQGYKIKPATIYQDNQSAMLLEKNGRRSSGKRTRHVNIRYFFVADRVASKEVIIKYCPTDQMVADFFTKPLQGSAFIRHRNAIMNIAKPSNHQHAPDQSAPIKSYKDALIGAQECVGASLGTKKKLSFSKEVIGSNVKSDESRTLREGGPDDKVPI